MTENTALTRPVHRVRAVGEARDPRDPLDRLARLLDAGSLEVVTEPGRGVVVATGTIDGAPVVGFCTDARLMGGAIGAEDCLRILAATERAVLLGCPVIGLWHSGGAKLADGVEAMEGIGRMFGGMVRASGRVPQISVVLGPAAGGAAYGPALTDVVILAPAGRVFITGPDVVRSVTGEEIDMAGLGGADAHGRRSGVAHVVADSEDDALRRARRLATLLTRPGTHDPGAVREPRDLRALLPESPRRAYDVRPLILAILDGPFEELQAKWAPNMVVGLGRLAGGTVGVVANNPLRKGGCLDSLSAEKASRFVRMCDAFGIPLLVLVDVPGYLPGVRQEWEGVVRRGAKLLYAFAEAVVPRVTLVTRKSYGGAYIAMNSRSLGATAVFAWPDAEVAVMGAESAVGILHRKRLSAAPEGERERLRAELVEEQRRVAGGVGRGLALGAIDEVVDPAATRARLAEAFAAATADAGRRRGPHGNIPL
ncbi:acyl-CoA carboxylase subunit beta [Acrocarpospora catenulata]|uniref:acyl-CoA carboxylase subunit beta n=1 Tax=Acrocarpospora catenulata TaxID=2836182 RepID=UPI001BD91BCA|nr:carboxyl transferase domain-containing protein [Acrocarpospora catenulata]